MFMSSEQLDEFQWHFRKKYTYDNIKVRKKSEIHHLFGKHNMKNHMRVQIGPPSSSFFRFKLGIFCITIPELPFGERARKFMGRLLVFLKFLSLLKHHSMSTT